MNSQETAKEYFLSALTAMQNNALPEAESLLRRALDLVPERVSVLTNLAVILINLKKPDEALIYAEKSVNLDRQNTEGWLNLAKCHELCGRNRSSIECLEEAHQLDPKSVRVLYELSRIYQQENEINRALLYLAKGRVIEFGDAAAFSDYGVALFNAGNLNQALVNFDQAIALKPDLAEAYSNRGNVLGNLKQHQAAIVSCDKAIEFKPVLAEAYSSRGYSLQELKRYEEAVASCDQAVALKPDFAEAYHNRANSLRDLKRYDEAVASYRKAIELQPAYSLASENLGYTYLLLGKHAEGLALIAKHSGFIRFTSASGVRLVLEVDHGKN